MLGVGTARDVLIVVVAAFMVRYAVEGSPMPFMRPADTESMVTEMSPSGSASTTAEPSTRAPSFAGGMLPLNVPVRVSMSGNCAVGSSLKPSAPYTPATVAVWLTFGPAARGVTAVVLRGDSSEDGPERTEFTSNAVTA